MKNLMKITGVCMVAMVLVFAPYGCSKLKSTTAHMTVKMVDAPALYDAVNVEVKQVMVHFAADSADSTSAAGWVNLNTKAGIYNLLDLQNNVMATIADSTLRPGRINQFRLVLGDSNTIVKDSVSYALKIPSGSQTGLKINVNSTLVAGAKYEMVIDFDAAKSIVVTGNGSFMLKPHLALKELIKL